MRELGAVLRKVGDAFIDVLGRPLDPCETLGDVE